MLGFFWSFINPLLLLLIYSFVFTVVLPNVHDQEIEPYALFMFCGILPWTWFSSSLIESSGVAHRRRQPDQEGAVPGRGAADRQRAGEHGALLPRPADPRGFLIDYRHPPDPRELLWFPVIVLVQLVFTLGLALIVSALTVHFRDIRDILQPADALVLRDADHLS